VQPKITYQLAAWATQQRYKGDSYAVNKVIGAVDTFCRLKTFAGVSSCVKNWRKRKAEIAEKCLISQSTLFRRMEWLHQQGWLNKDYSSLSLKSWHNVHELLEITYDKKFFTSPPKKENETHTHYWIYLAEIVNNKDRQDYMIIKKLNKNHNVKADLLAALKQQGVDINKCESTTYLLNQLQQLYIKSFVVGSNIHELLCAIRPDNNRSCVGMGKAWQPEIVSRLNRTSAKNEYDRLAMLASYVKKKMKTQGVAIIQRPGTIESELRQRNSECHVMYNKHNKTTFQALCDDITVAQPVNASNLEFKIPVAA
jgi:hypothetical protein